MTTVTFEGSMDLAERDIWIGTFEVIAEIGAEDGTWWVSDIALDTYRDGKKAKVVLDSELQYRSPFFARLNKLINDELMTTFKSQIVDLINAEEDLLRDAGDADHYYDSMRDAA